MSDNRKHTDIVGLFCLPAFSGKSEKGQKTDLLQRSKALNFLVGLHKKM